eukprot:1041364-Amorphochlora_amoeboformis.AAC.1
MDRSSDKKDDYESLDSKSKPSYKGWTPRKNTLEWHVLRIVYENTTKGEQKVRFNVLFTQRVLRQLTMLQVSRNTIIDEVQDRAERLIRRINEDEIEKEIDEAVTNLIKKQKVGNAFRLPGLNF